MEGHYVKMKAVSHQECQYDGRKSPKMSLFNVVQQETLCLRDGTTDGTFPEVTGLLSLRKSLKIMSAHGAG